MNAGELVISLLLKAGSFKAEVEDAQRRLDTTGDIGAQAMAQVGTGARQAGQEMAAAAARADAAQASLDKTGAVGAEAMNKVGKAAQKAGNDMAGAATTAGSAWKALMPTLTKVAGLLGVGLSIKGAVNTYLEQADALGKYSDSLGVAVEDVQAWEEAVKHAGGTGEGFRQSLQGLTANLTAIATTGKGRMLPFLQQLGISAKDANGKVKDAMELLPELAEKFEKMAPAEAAGFGEKLGLDKGVVMLLQQGRKATEEAVKAGKEHIRFTKADTEAAAKANDAIQDMQTSLMALIARAVAPAIPLLTKFAQIIHTAAQWISENSETVTAFFIAVGTILMRQGIPAMLKFAASTRAAIAPFLPIIAAVAALGVALDDLWAFITGGDSVLERMLKRFGVTQETIDGLRDALRNVIGFFLDLWDAVTGEGKDADAAWNRVKATWEEMKNWFKGLIDQLLGWFGDMVDKIKNWLLDLIPGPLRGLLSSDDGKKAQGEQTHTAAASGDAEAARAYTQNYDAWGTPLAAMARPGDMGAGGAKVDNSRHVQQSTSVGQVNVYTRATDAEGIAGDMTDAIRNQTAQLDGAY